MCDRSHDSVHVRVRSPKNVMSESASDTNSGTNSCPKSCPCPFISGVRVILKVFGENGHFLVDEISVIDFKFIKVKI